VNVKIRALLKTGLISNLFEWYEWAIYGFLASYLGQLFFNPTHPNLALIQVFAVFSASYLIRPLGSLVLGALSDQKGRSYALKLSFLLMSIPSVLTGLLPTYQQIGGWATVTLICLRLIQSFGAGGEAPILGCYMFENAPTHYHQGILCSTIIASAVGGSLLGSAIAALCNYFFTQEAMLAWGWRIPFLIGLPMSCYIFHIRQYIQDNPSDLKDFTYSKLSAPLVSLVKISIKQTLQATILASFKITVWCTVIVWLPSALHLFLDIPQKVVFLAHSLTLAIMVLLYLGAGWLSTQWGYKPLMILSILGISLIVYPIFLLLKLKLLSVLLLAGFLFGFFLSGIDPLMVQCLGDLFPKAFRSSGMGLSQSLGASIGGLSPMICTYLVHQTGSFTAPAFYIMAFGLLALPVAFKLKSNKTL
jgi:MHS family proline/betaine transporter-like MFS transporter